MQRLLPFLTLLALVACKNDKPAESPSSSSSSSASAPTSNEQAGCKESSKVGRTAVAGAKTGLEAAADGIVQAGSTGAGLVHGGTEEAKEKWNDGKKETKDRAKKNAAETKQEAHTPRCK